MDQDYDPLTPLYDDHLIALSNIPSGELSVEDTQVANRISINTSPSAIDMNRKLWDDYMTGKTPYRDFVIGNIKTTRVANKRQKIANKAAIRNRDIDVKHDLEFAKMQSEYATAERGHEIQTREQDIDKYKADLQHTAEMGRQARQHTVEMDRQDKQHVQEMARINIEGQAKNVQVFVALVETKRQQMQADSDARLRDQLEQIEAKWLQKERKKWTSL